MTREEMDRQDKLPTPDQSDEFLDICAKHGNPCIMHGGKCDHNAMWLRLLDHMFYVQVRCKDVDMYQVIEVLYRQVEIGHPWSSACYFDLEQCIKEGSYAVRNKHKKRLIAGLEKVVAAGHMLFTPDAGEQYKGILAWNTSRVPKWIDRGASGKSKTDRVLLTIEQLTASGRLSESFMQRIPAREWKRIRSFVLERDDFTCQYCGAIGGTLHIDHIIPVGRGGNDLDNLVTACEECNRRKHARTPEEWLS